MDISNSTAETKSQRQSHISVDIHIPITQTTQFLDHVKISARSESCSDPNQIGKKNKYSKNTTPILQQMQ